MEIKNSVARLARDIPKKTSKGMAFEALDEVLTSLAGADIDQDTEAALARLWAHFMPGRVARPKTAFDWTAKAMATKDERFYLTYFKVTEDKLIATDGHRLHIAQNEDGLAPGFYGHEGVWLEPEDSMKYPDIERVTPDPEGSGREWLETTTAELELETKYTKVSGKDVVLNAYRVGATGPYVNADYLNAAVSLEDGPLRINVGDATSTVLLVSGDGKRKAIIVPIRW